MTIWNSKNNDHVLTFPLPLVPNRNELLNYNEYTHLPRLYSNYDSVKQNYATAWTTNPYPLLPVPAWIFHYIQYLFHIEIFHCHHIPRPIVRTPIFLPHSTNHNPARLELMSAKFRYRKPATFRHVKVLLWSPQPLWPLWNRTRLKPKHPSTRSPSPRHSYPYQKHNPNRLLPHPL